MKNTPQPMNQNRRKRQVATFVLAAAIRNQRGNTMLELALALCLCSTLILGAAEFGRLAYAGIEISNAAHAGAQYGAQSHTSASDSSGMRTAATQDGPNVTGMTATASHYCTCTDGSTSTCSAGDCSASRLIEFVKVNTTAAVDPLIYVPGLPRTYTLTGQAVMRVEQ